MGRSMTKGKDVHEATHLSAALRTIAGEATETCIGARTSRVFATHCVGVWVCDFVD